MHQHPLLVVEWVDYGTWYPKYAPQDMGPKTLYIQCMGFWWKPDSLNSAPYRISSDPPHLKSWI